MKTKKLGIVIMAVLLIALIAVYVSVNGKWSDDDLSTDTGTGTSSYTVAETDVESICGISFTNEDFEYSFTLSDGVWRYDTDDKFPVDGAVLDEMASALSSVTASRVLEGENTESAEFGLDTPTHVIKVKCADGGELEYSIGDYNKHSDSYYMSAKGQNKVFMVDGDFESLFACELYDMLLLEEMESISENTVTKITATASNGTITLEVTEKQKEDIVGPTAEDASGSSSEDTESDTVYIHTNAQGGSAELDAEDALDIIGALCSVSLDKCRDYYAEADELTAYGLDESGRTKITIYYTVELSASTASTTSTSGTTLVEKECSFYIGRVTEAAPESEEESSEDTAVQTSGGTSTDGENAEGERTDKTVEKTYLVLESSSMIFDVDISGADLFFE
ncbi:MAG: DUF4340 domain-containing protein [Clostridia bacterium]|nr:DUF4340 domain-containing protein [Clostridia bacterium]